LPLRPASGETAAAQVAPIKVLSVNVSFRQFSARRLLEIVREADPDLVIVQELTPYADRVLAELDVTFPHTTASFRPMARTASACGRA
jgi:hypothetical protein